MNILLLHGADASVANNSGTTAIIYAGLAKTPDKPAMTISLLLAGPPNSANYRMDTSLMVVVHHQDNAQSFLAFLVEHGVVVNACNSRGISVVDGTIAIDHVYAVAYLLEVEARPHGSNEDQIADLHAAVNNDSHKL